jgi:hypothetical protein
VKEVSTLSSYKYIELKVRCIMPLISSLFIRDVTLHWYQCSKLAYLGVLSVVTFLLCNNNVSSWGTIIVIL